MRWGCCAYRLAVTHLAMVLLLLPGCSGGGSPDRFDTRLVGSWSGTCVNMGVDGTTEVARYNTQMAVTTTGAVSGTLGTSFAPGYSGAFTGSIAPNGHFGITLVGANWSMGGTARYVGGHLLAKLEFWGGNEWGSTYKMAEYHFDLTPQ